VLSAVEGLQVAAPALQPFVVPLALAVLVLHLGSSSNLAAAYGIAVTGTFITTTILAFIVLRTRSRLPRSLTWLGMAMFLIID
jgi:KUP system potassium uptake protein